MTIYVGIDPGNTGAIAVLDPLSTPEVFDLTDDQITLSRVRTRAGAHRCTVLVERPDGRPGKGMVQALTGAGWLKGWWDGSGAVTRWVPATVWTGAMGVGRDKEESLELARRLFPELAPLLKRKKDHNRAQALLIAEYARRNQL